MKNNITRYDREIAVELYLTGEYTIQHVANRFSVSASTVYRWVRAHCWSKCSRTFPNRA
jgi:transposase-like protein